jgi:hypothetical protein
MRLALATALGLLALTWALYLTHPELAYDPVPQGQGQSQRIAEDDPRWDCRIMGNKEVRPICHSAPWRWLLVGLSLALGQGHSP